MSENVMEGGGKKLFGFIKGDKERKIVFIAAIAGIVGLFLYIKDKQQASSGGSAQAGEEGYGSDFVLDSGSGIGGGGTGGSGTGFEGILGEIAGNLQDIEDLYKSGPVGSKIEFDYALDNSSSFSTDAKYSSGGSSGFGLSFSGIGGGGGLSFSNSSTKTKQISFEDTTKDIFQNRTTAEGLAANQVTELMNFFKTVGGTYEQRQEADARRSEDRYAKMRLAASGVVSTKTLREVDNLKTEAEARKEIKVDSIA